MYKVIIDSDWGGDVLQLTCVLATQPETYEFIGATVTFGNAALPQNVLNAGSMLRLMQMDDKVPYFSGAFGPSGTEAPPEGDCAHGTTGLGKAVVAHSEVPPSEQDAVDFILETVAREPVGTVILLATAPQTNVARAIKRAPEVMRKLKEIRIMAGCIRPLKGYRVDANDDRLSEDTIDRYGNITELAEFNYQQAPHDAETVLQSGIPVALFPMDCTHQMCFTEARQARLEKAFENHPKLTEQLIGLMSGPRYIDAQKFSIDPTLHDAHTTLEMLRPDLYTGRQGTIEVIVNEGGADHGHTKFVPNPKGPHWVAEDITDPDAAFDLLVDCMREIILKTAPASA